jgi:hypothetical protein
MRSRELREHRPAAPRGQTADWYPKVFYILDAREQIHRSARKLHGRVWNATKWLMARNFPRRGNFLLSITLIQTIKAEPEWKF